MLIYVLNRTPFNQPGYFNTKLKTMRMAGQSEMDILKDLQYLIFPM